jgi:hypothetical protein
MLYIFLWKVENKAMNRTHLLKGTGRDSADPSKATHIISGF